MLRWLCLLFLCLALPAAASAQDDESRARSLFEEGVALSGTGDYAQAAERFEASLALVDRPATRVNLVHAYAALKRPLDLARHALAFLRLPEAPHRAEVRRDVASALAEVVNSLASVGTESLPPGSVLRVDGSEPLVRDGARVFVLPGLHRLEVELPGEPPEVIELALGAGQSVPWPRQVRAPAAAPPALPVAAPTVPVSAPLPAGVAPVQPPDPTPPWRRRLGLVSGTLGASVAAAAVSTYVLTLKRERDVRDADPFATGFAGTYDGYRHASRAVAPLSAAAGALLALSVASSPHASRWGSRGTAYAALAVGAALLATGVVFAARRPDDIPGTSAPASTRQSGLFALASAAPFVSYGVTFLIRLEPSRRGGAVLESGAQGLRP